MSLFFQDEVAQNLMSQVELKNLKLELIPSQTRSKLSSYISLEYHMWLEGCPNPHKMEQSCEYTFLEFFVYMNTKWASKKKDFIIVLQK